MAEQDSIDKLLERALGEYSATSARVGLEERVLARLEAESESRRKLRWWWIAVPALAALVMVAVLVAWRPRRRDVEVANATPVRVEVPSEPPSINETPKRDWMVRRPLKPARPKRPARSNPQGHDSEPRLATFPAPDDNSQLLRMAAQFVQQYPQEAQQIVREQDRYREMAEAFTAPLK
jgi:hypothetical protein